MGSNPVVSAPHATHIEERLGALDFLVVCDFFLSETARLADVVLPSAQWAEEEGTMTNLEGRVLRRRRVVEPPRGVRTDLEILRGLARALGSRDRLLGLARGAVLRGAARGDGRRAGRLLGHHAGADRSRAGRVLAVPVDGHARARRASSPIAFHTPTGRARFHRVRAVRTGRAARSPSTRSISRPAACWRSTSRARRRAASAGCCRAAREAEAEMHPRAAQRSGLADGGEVTIETRRGRASFRLKTTPGIREDTIFVPFHWGGRAVGEPPDQSRRSIRSAGCRSSRCARRGSPRRDSGGATADENAIRRLVVIGNGMAGARLVEEVVARDARRVRRSPMFGDEPYGNYNRILLSGVLAGTHDPQDIFINPLAWYEQAGVRLHAGVRGRAHRSRRTPSSSATTAASSPTTSSSSRPAARAFVPPLDGLVTDTGALSRRRLRVPHARRLRRRSATTPPARAAPRSSAAACSGSKPRAASVELGVEVHVVHLMPHLMEVQLDEAAGGMLRAAMERLGVHDAPRAAHDAPCSATARSPGCCSTTVRGSTATWWSSPPASARTSRSRATPACAVERGIVVGDDLRSANDPHIFAIGECAQHRGQVYGLVAPLWEQAQVLADRLTGANARAVYAGSRVSTKLKVMGVDLAVMGDKEPARPATRSCTTPSRRAASTRR